MFGAYVALCKQVSSASRAYAAEDPNSPLALLRADVPATLRSASRVLKAKSPKTRIGVLGALKELAEVLPESVVAQVSLFNNRAWWQGGA